MQKEHKIEKAYLLGVGKIAMWYFLLSGRGQRQRFHSLKARGKKRSRMDFLKCYVTPTPLEIKIILWDNYLLYSENSIRLVV